MKISPILNVPVDIVRSYTITTFLKLPAFLPQEQAFTVADGESQLLMELGHSVIRAEWQHRVVICHLPSESECPLSVFSGRSLTSSRPAAPGR